MNISSSKQQESKGLDNPPGVRLVGNKARGYTRARTTDQLEELIKQNTTYNKLSPYHYSTNRGRTWVKIQIASAVNLQPLSLDLCSNHLTPLQWHEQLHQCQSENKKDSDQSSYWQDSEGCYQVVKKTQNPNAAG